MLRAPWWIKAVLANAAAVSHKRLDKTLFVVYCKNTPQGYLFDWTGDVIRWNNTVAAIRQKNEQRKR